MGAEKKFGFMPCEPSALAGGSYTFPLFNRPLLARDQGAIFVMNYSRQAY